LSCRTHTSLNSKDAAVTVTCGKSVSIGSTWDACPTTQQCYSCNSAAVLASKVTAKQQQRSRMNELMNSSDLGDGMHCAGSFQQSGRITPPEAAKRQKYHQARAASQLTGRPAQTHQPKTRAQSRSFKVRAAHRLSNHSTRRYLPSRPLGAATRRVIECTQFRGNDVGSSACQLNPKCLYRLQRCCGSDVNASLLFAQHTKKSTHSGAVSATSKRRPCWHHSQIQPFHAQAFRIVFHTLRC
jgi:hypothetical protein